MEDKSKVTETQATETATTVVSDSPAQEPKRGSKKMLLMITAIAAPVLLVLGGLGVVAANRGKDNVFSKIANYLPTEQIPLLKELGKSDSVTLRDAFSKEAGSLEVIKDLGGREQKVTVGVELAGKDQNGKAMEGNLQLDTTMATNKDASKAKYDLKISGNVKSDIVNIDLGTEGIKADVLMPDKNAIYMSFNLSKEVLDTFGPKIDSELAGSGYQLKDILGKYTKLDIAQLTKDLEAMGGTNMSANVDQEKLRKAAQNLADALGKDTKALYEKTLGDFEKYTTLTNEGRKTVNGQKAIVIKAEVKEDKVGDVLVDFTEGFIKVLKDHKSDLEKFCTEMELEKTSGQKCSEMFTDKTFDEIKFDDTAKGQMREAVKMMFEYVKFEDVRFSVNVEDNTLVKSEMNIRLTDKALAEMSKSGNGTFSKFLVKLSTEELSRGKDINVEAPKEYTDLNKIIKETLEKKQNQLQDLKKTPNPLDMRTPQDQPLAPTPTKSAYISAGQACKVNATVSGTIDMLGQCISSKEAGSPCLAYADDEATLGVYETTKEFDFGVCVEK